MTPLDPPRPTGTRIPALDGLRGLAVLGVLLFHGGFPWAGGGFLGVSLFFTLSGFLITGLLVDEHARAGRIDLGRFWSRRLRRLLPAALLALAGIALFGATVADGDQLRTMRADGLAALAHVANWRFIVAGRSYGDIFRAPSPLQHYWSLAIEEQFYVVFPLLGAAVLGRGRHRRRAFALACGAGVIASVAVTWWLYSPGDGARAYYGTDTRAAELLVGALAALWWRHRSDGSALAPTAARVAGVLGSASLAVLLVAWSLAATGDDWLYRGGLAGVAVLGAVVIVGAAGPGPLRRLLSWPPLRAIGAVSYGLYLFHWPVFLWLSPRRTGLAIAPLFALRLSVTAVAAFASSVLVERPVLERRLVRWRPGWSAAAASLVVAVALVAVTAHAPPPTFDLRTADAASATASAPPTSVVPVAPGRPEPIRILVVGDSLAGVLAEGLARWGRDTGRATVWNTSIAGCGIVRGGDIWFNGRIQRIEPGCDAWPERWRADISTFAPDVVVVHSGPWDIAKRRLPSWKQFRELGDETFDAHLVDDYREAARVLTSTGTAVAWITSPCFDPFVESSDKMYDDAAVARLGRRLLPEALAGLEGGVRVVDLYSRVCPGDAYTDRLGGETATRPDGVHFIPETADWIAAWMGPQLLRQVEARRAG